MIAALPMYDWPEVKAETDALWRALRDAFRAAGFAAPEARARPADLFAHWLSPELLLSQTCGLPFSARLRGAVTLLGAPAYDLPGCAQGDYRSVVVVRAEEAAGAVADFAGRAFAFNMAESQSGFAAFAASFGPPAALFGALVETGAHRLSIRAVAEGRADIASIDAVTWRLALDHEPAARALRVLAETPPTPGLPWITARRGAEEAARLAEAAEAGIAALGPAARAALHLNGFARRVEADYEPLAAGWPAENWREAPIDTPGRAP
ncbi:MAG: phosphate/phosphite/phosphonate ABC transporter substrate-binding protein [Pikeienuella sp.]|uniref:phosphate/phosphite/phosphonate ABC transporter substrate-binding protein n=1 Tax=Pikeienuella sp. TaxID=2831957 RepID=UPI00391DF9A9